MGSFSQLSSAVLDKSESKTWRSCIAEWVVVDCDEDESADGTCICGKEGLRYLYTVRNEINGNELYPIGSECIKKFDNGDLEDEARCWKQTYRLVDLAEKYGKNRAISFSRDKGMFSRKLLAFMYRKGAFPATRWNEWDGGNDYRFMLDVFNAHTMTLNQRMKSDYVMRDSVYPWLREMYKQRHKKEGQI